MTTACDWVRENAPDLVTGVDVPADVGEHLTGCAECQAVTAGAESLRSDLDAWSVPEPSDDLVERTLARLALTAAAAAPAAADLPQPTLAPALKLHAGGGSRRRTSVEILTSTHLSMEDEGEPPSRRRLFLRLCVQSAAAVAMFAVCTTFVAVFYPAVTHALEERRLHSCQERLARLAKAAAQYHREHPEAPELRNATLRRALVSGGYADEHDFVCTGANGEELGVRSFVGSLPAGDQALPRSRPVYHDQFSNHTTGFNVAYADGRVETITAENFARWRPAR